MADPLETRAYARGYAAGVRRGRMIAKVARAELARLQAKTIPASTALPAQPAPVVQPTQRARLHIIVPGRAQGIDLLWERELCADDLEMARDQIVALLNRWIKARQPKPDAGVDSVDGRKP